MTLSFITDRAPITSLRPLNAIVGDELLGQLNAFFQRLISERERLTIDGVSVFTAGDQFLPGKICVGFANLLLSSPSLEAENGVMSQSYRGVLDFVAPMKNESWGIYYACAGLIGLKKAGLLESSVSPIALSLLRERADWRRFVRTSDYSLIDLPTNYYGVAFSVARIRMLLGWEDATASEALLEKTLDHYSSHSGDFGFCDDTDGEGRFDRYSILLIAEICERFFETDLPVTENLLKLLRNSVDVVLKLANANGDGFSFGRSLGPYGDTAMMQILTVAGTLKVLTPEEIPYAYTICAAIAEKYVAFWFNHEIHSVDMWGQGRRVDAYRGKSRIFGENLSLTHQIVSANRLWTGAGFCDAAPHTPAQLREWLDATQPPFSVTAFAKGLYDRSLAIYRDNGRVFALLMVNGGSGQHMNSPYYPLPFSPGVLEGIADSGFAAAQLMPKLTMIDGSQLIGTAFFKNIHSASEGQTHRLTYQLETLSRLGSSTPIPDDRLSAQVEYLFEPGKITRTERFIPRLPVTVQSVVLDFLCFSGNPEQQGARATFADGVVRTFAVSGVEVIDIENIREQQSFKSPNGPMCTHVHCRQSSFEAHEPFEIQWSIQYS